MQRISSAQNPIIKEIKTLNDRKNRDALKKYFIEGKKFVEEAFSYPEQIDYLVISDSYMDIIKASSEGAWEGTEFESIEMTCSKYQISLIQVPNHIFELISDTKNPQGILAVMKQTTLSFSHSLNTSAFVVILDTLQDPGNVGTIIRTADAAAVDAIFISKGSVDIYSPKVLRATMGSIFHLPIYRYETFDELHQLLKVHQFKLLSTHLDGASSLYDLGLTSKIAVVIGNEAKGVSPEIVAVADILMKIPMPGKSESLNASAAASIIIYECLRQRIAQI